MSESEEHEPHPEDGAPGESQPPAESYPEETTASGAVHETPPRDGVFVGERAVNVGAMFESVAITSDNATVEINKYELGGLHSLSEFEVKETEKDELLNSFVQPVNYDEVARHVLPRRLIWIYGPPEAGKGTLALQLALTRLPFQNTYRLRGKQHWKIISKADVEDSTVVLIDAVYLAGAAGEAEAAPADFEALDEPELEGEELDAAAEVATAAAEPDATVEAEVEDEEAEDAALLLRNLLDSGNTVIGTSTEEVYERARGTLQSAGLARTSGFAFPLSAESYGRAQRLELIKKAVNLAHNKWRSGEVKHSALRACDELAREDEGDDSHPIIREWLPGEICSFVSSVLVNAKSADEVEAELKVPLGRRVHSWFMELKEESTRLFVLTRTLFPGLGDNDLEKRLGEIVNSLKETYSLALTSIGVYAYRASPYISTNPPHKFVNNHVLRAASDVVAQFYQRPFAELSELLKKWSVPAGLETAATGGENKRRQEQLIKETAATRESVARMAGRVGRHNLASVKELLDYWAGHRLGRIGQAAGIALRHAAANEGNCEEVLSLIEGWVKKPAQEAGHFRRRSAADALWRLVAAGLPSAKREQALRLLEYLAKDSNPFVRRTTAFAVAQVAEAYEQERVRKVLESLACDSRDGVRADLAVYLAWGVRQRDRFMPLVEEWAGSDDERLAEVAVIYLLCNWGRRNERALLHRIMGERPALSERAMKTAARLAVRRRGGALTWPVLRTVISDLAASREDPAWRQGLAAVVNLRRWAAAGGGPDAAALVKGLLKRWDDSRDAALRLAASACHFAAGRDAEERLSLLKERLGPLVSGGAAPPAMVAKRLVWMAGQDRAAVHKLLQDWLVNGDDDAVAAVIFYWLVAPDEPEPDRYRHLTSTLCNFPQPFERAMRLAVELLPAETLGPALQSLASDERTAVRKQASLALGRMAALDAPYVYRLLEDWLALDEEKAGPTVVLFWVAAGDYAPELRCKNLEGILRCFPHAFDRGIRAAVGVWGAGCLEPLADDLHRFTSSAPGGGAG